MQCVVKFARGLHWFHGMHHAQLVVRVRGHKQDCFGLVEKQMSGERGKHVQVEVILSIVSSNVLLLNLSNFTRQMLMLGTYTRRPPFSFFSSITGFFSRWIRICPLANNLECKSLRKCTYHIWEKKIPDPLVVLTDLKMRFVGVFLVPNAAPIFLVRNNTREHHSHFVLILTADSFFFFTDR